MLVSRRETRGKGWKDVEVSGSRVFGAATEGSPARVARRVAVRQDPSLREKSRLEPKYRGLTRGAGGRAAGRCAHQVSDPEGLHLAGLGGVRLRHRAPFGGSGGYAARCRRERPAREIATCFFSPPTGKRGSLICLRAGVFVNERARSVDPKRGRCSEKGAELTREGLARAFVRSLGVV